MAGLMDRVKTILGAKANSALDAIEDPTQTIDYSYEKMQEALQETKRHVIEVATAKKQLEMQLATLTKKAADYDADAREAVASGRDDLATQALALKATVQHQVDDLSEHVKQTAAEEEKLTAAQKQLEAKIESFRSQKEVMKAEYSAAKAQVAIGETIHGISQHAEDISGSLDRAQDKIQQMQARASAIDELDETGALGPSSDESSDPIRQQLEAAKSSSSLQDELAKLKAEVKGS
jgi:phage shock protein A